MKALITAAWLTGILSQADPKKYPKLEALTGDEPEKPKIETDPSEASGNARAWGAVLSAMNREAGVAKR